MNSRGDDDHLAGASNIVENNEPGGKAGLQVLHRALLSVQMQHLSYSMLGGNGQGTIGLDFLQQLGLEELRELQLQRDNIGGSATAIPETNHNAKNAFFEISSDIAHGHDLICSHGGCQVGGVKFCYCSHCGVPVAKRNFRKRHEHADESERVDLKAATTAGVPIDPIAKPATTVIFRVHGDDQKRKEPPATICLSGDRSSKKSRTVTSESEAASSNLLDSGRQLKWSSLLGERPPSDDDAGMSSWLLQVMAISSDKESASDNSGNTSGLTESQGEQESSTDSTSEDLSEKKPPAKYESSRRRHHHRHWRSHKSHRGDAKKRRHRHSEEHRKESRNERRKQRHRDAHAAV